MWISKARFVELVRAEERSELLRLRVNQLEGDLGHERHLRTGEPQRVAEFVTPRRKPRPEPTPDQQSLAQIEMGLKIFEHEDTNEDVPVQFDGVRVAIQ